MQHKHAYEIKRYAYDGNGSGGGGDLLEGGAHGRGESEPGIIFVVHCCEGLNTVQITS